MRVHNGGLKRRTFLLSPLALAAAGTKPDVLIVIARGWRGVDTPWSGAADIKAPQLEAFAKEAIVFPRAYAACPASADARTSILSGRFPHAASSGDAPSFRCVVLGPGRFPSRPESEKLHVRDNVPADSSAKIREALSMRYGSYASIDEQFGKLLDGIDAANTIIVFTSDAGEQIGSHGLEGDDSFYEESSRVVLAIRFPNVRPAASDLLVSHVDILPTVVGLLGDPPIAGVQGRDLSWLLTSGRGDRPEFVFAEGRMKQRDEWRMLVLGTDKLVVNAAGDPTHLFNLARDPYEMNNLVRDPSVELKRAQLVATIRAERSRLLDFRRR